MQPSPNNAQMPGNNVEVLGFTPAPSRSAPQAEQPIDLAPIVAAVEQSHQATIAVIQHELPKVVVQITEIAVKRALASSNNSVLAVFKAIGIILAVRFIVLLSLVGAFALAFMAMANPTWPSIAIMISYVLLTVLPLVWLDSKSRRSPNE